MKCIRGGWLTNSDLVAGVAPGCCSIHEVAIAGAALHATMSQMMSFSHILGFYTACAVLPLACPALVRSMPSENREAQAHAYMCTLLEGSLHIGCMPWHQRNTCGRQMHSQGESSVGMAWELEDKPAESISQPQPGDIFMTADLVLSWTCSGEGAGLACCWGGEQR